MSEESPSGEWDHVARQLHVWRRCADDPSYSEIALRISRNRELAGMAPATARIGRTTVYDAFRLGRARINLGLVREIARALGADEAQLSALLNQPSAPADAAVPPRVITEPMPIRYDVGQALAIMTGCLLLNVVGRQVVDYLALPIYLDMVGTALAAIVLGPWRGAVVGASSSVLLTFVTGFVSLPFAIVNVVGALIWGYGVHHWHMGQSLARFFALTFAVSVACSAAAVPILYLIFDGTAGHQQEHLVTNMLGLTSSPLAAMVAANLQTSVADKMISAFVALVGASLLGHSVAGIVASPGTRRSRADLDDGAATA